MATWTNITDAALEPGRPIRSVDGLALRDNAIAIAEGASGAPRISGANALGQAGEVGTYAELIYGAGGAMSPGTVKSGSSLTYGSGGSPSGSWRAMGGAPSTGFVTLWLRIL